MSSIDAAAVMRQAWQDVEAGRLQQALAAAQQVLQHDPQHADAHYMTGLLLQQAGHSDQALQHVDRAIAANPSVADYHFIAAEMRRAMKQYAGAAAAYRRAAELDPNLAEAHWGVGFCLEQLRQRDDAIAAFRRAIAVRPDFVAAHVNLGAALFESGRIDEAIECFQTALRHSPKQPLAQMNLAAAYQAKGDLASAADCLRRLVADQPGKAELHLRLARMLQEQGQLQESLAHYDAALAIDSRAALPVCERGVVLQKLNRLDEAEEAYRQALRMEPSLTVGWLNLGSILQGRQRIEEAISCYQKAARLDPDSWAPRYNLGTLWQHLGDLEQAMEAYRAAINLSAEPLAHSNFVLCLNYDPRQTPQSIRDEHVRWARRFAQPLAPACPPAPRDPNPDRPLRIGYVSGDFRHHVVSYFIEPILACHDRAAFEVYCYSNVREPDDVTRRLRTYATEWREIFTLSDAQAADLIRADGVDILVDLAGHTAFGRLLVFARKPAPIQAAYLGYQSTTGMDTVDYRLTDPHLDPPGGSDAFYTEKLIRLPHTFFAWQPPASDRDLPVSPPPVLACGHVTFGVFNNPLKVTAPIVRLWSQILQAVGGSRLMIVSGMPSADRRLMGMFQRHGIGPERIELIGRMPRVPYMHLYDRVDICLDTHPFAGHATTLDTLWMGAAIVTLAGQTFSSRLGVTTLTNAGLGELIAYTPEQYVHLAIQLARDRDRLAAMRQTLRQKLREAKFADIPAVTRAIEGAYRQMWRERCRS